MPVGVALSVIVLASVRVWGSIRDSVLSSRFATQTDPAPTAIEPETDAHRDLPDDTVRFRVDHAHRIRRHDQRWARPNRKHDADDDSCHDHRASGDGHASSPEPGSESRVKSS